MRGAYRRAWAVLLICTSVLGALGPASAVGQSEQAQARIGGGARFLPPDTFVYVSFDPTQRSRLLDGLMQLFPDAPFGGEELQPGAAEGLRRLGVDPALFGLLGPWIGGEVFFAIPSLSDIEGLVSLGLGQVDLDCQDPGFLLGAAIGDRSAFSEFLRDWTAQLQSGGALTVPDRHNGTDVLWIRDNPEAAGLFAAVSNGYVLVSGSRSRLLEALEAPLETSLARATSFNDAVRRVPPSALALLYANAPSEIPPGLQSILELPPTPAPPQAVRWASAALTVADDQFRVDVAGGLDAGALTSTQRRLLGKPRNALRSAAVAPVRSFFFLGWDNLKLLWHVVVEAIWPDPQEYAAARAEIVASTGLDLEEDIFGWMTGEIGIIAAPGGEPGSFLSSAGLGLTIQVKDRALVQQKLDKIVQAVERLNLLAGPVTPQTIGGVSFRRLPVTPNDVVFLGLMEGWVVATSSFRLATEIVQTVGGAAALPGQPEYAQVRSALLADLQLLAYFNVGAIARAAAEAGVTEPDDAARVAEIFGGAGLAIDTSLDRVDGALVVRVQIEEDLPPIVSAEPARRTTRPVSVLIDASKAGALAEQLEPATSQDLPSVSPPLLRSFLAAQLGARLVDVVGPDERVGRREEAFAVQPREQLLLRVGSEGEYAEPELAVYQEYVRCGGTLLLLSAGKAPGESDGLASAFGFEVGGTARGQAGLAPSGGTEAGLPPLAAGPARMDRFEAHPATEGIPPFPMDGGTGLIGWDDFVQPLGYLSAETYLDLNGNGLPDADEPFEAPALALRRYGRGTVVFLGSTAMVQAPYQPLYRQLLGFLFPEAPLPELVAPDAYEPDDRQEQAKQLLVDGVPQMRSIHERFDQDWVSISLEAAEQVHLATRGPCDTTLILYGPGRGILAFDDDSGAEANASIVYTVDLSGSHYAQVQVFGTCASYELLARLEKGRTLYDLGQYEEALEAFDASLALRPDDPETLNNRGLALRRLGRHEEALEAFDASVASRLDALDRAVALNPNDASAHSNRGLLLWRLRRHEDALASYDRAVALEPARASNYNNRALAQASLGNLDQALADVDVALRLERHPFYLDTRGYVYLLRGEYESALADYDEAIGLVDRPSGFYLLGRGLALTHLDEEERGRADLAEGLRLAEDIVPDPQLTDLVARAEGILPSQ